jgi:hypothetical protein
MCSILCWILSIWEALGCNFCIFWLDSCIANKGEKFELDLACCMHLEGFQVVLGYFWAWAVSQVASAWPVRGTDLTGVVPRCWAILPTGLTVRVAGLTGQSWVVAAALLHVVVHMHSSSESCIGSGGACMCAGGGLCGFRALVWWFAALCLSIVLSRMCRFVALA